MSERLITIHSDNPKVRFENQLNLDTLEQAMARAMAMRLERLRGVPHTVKVTVRRREEMSETQAAAVGYAQN